MCINDAQDAAIRRVNNNPTFRALFNAHVWCSLQRLPKGQIIATLFEVQSNQPEQSEMAEAASRKQVEDLAAEIKILSETLSKQAPKKGFSAWFTSNSALLGVGIMILCSAFNFIGRLDKIDANIALLEKKIDDEFRSLSQSISELKVQLAHDEGNNR